MAGPSDKPMQPSEHAALRAFLQGKGAKAAEVLTAAGAAANGRSRQQVETAVTAWLKTRPKG